MAGWRRKAKSRVSRRKDDNAVPARVTRHHRTSLDQNRKTSFLSTSSSNKEPFSASFEVAECCEIPSSEKVDSALDIKKCTKIRHRSFRKRRKGSHHEQHMAYNSLQVPSDFGSIHLSSVRRPERWKDSENKNDISMPATIKLVPSIENEANNAFDYSKNVCIVPEVKLDSSNSSDIRTYGKEFNMERKKKRKRLKNEVHEHSADTASLHDSIIPTVERALRSPFRKKLLVLDLNGILCDVVFYSHGSSLPYKKVGMRSVFKRPFLDDFLAFCFERFVVGIWSSRNKNNVIGIINYVMGDSKDRLLFYWDQSKCTHTGFNTLENKHKPMVFKELIKLWDKDEACLPWQKGEYSPSNTLLVDDSPYKALCNPPHTAIFPLPYDLREEGDSALGPDGALRVYLEGVAVAEDVQEHVKKHSFGQQAITPKHKMWSFYKNFIDKSRSKALT